METWNIRELINVASCSEKNSLSTEKFKVRKTIAYVKGFI